MKKPADAARPPLGRDVGDHGNGRGDDLLDGLAHRVHQAAGRVQADEDNLGALRTRLLDRAGDDFDGDGVDHAVHVHGDHFFGAGRCRKQERSD